MGFFKRTRNPEWWNSFLGEMDPNYGISFVMELEDELYWLIDPMYFPNWIAIFEFSQRERWNEMNPKTTEKNLWGTPMCSGSAVFATTWSLFRFCFLTFWEWIRLIALKWIDICFCWCALFSCDLTLSVDISMVLNWMWTMWWFVVFRAAESLAFLYWNLTLERLVFVCLMMRIDVWSTSLFPFVSL